MIPDQLAEAKSLIVSKQYPDRWVIGVDTLVVAESGELLEKPLDADDARRMLHLHSGRTSIVHSGLSLQKNGKIHTNVSTASVFFQPLMEDDIEWWIITGLWKDRSGAFQLEGEGERLITKIEGERETVIGFPVLQFRTLLPLLC